MIRRPHSSRSTLGGCDCESRPPACSGRDVVQVARTALLRRVAAATESDEDLLLRGAAAATKSDEDLLQRRVAAATRTCSCKELLRRRRPVPVKGSSGGGCPGLAWGGGGARAMVRSTTCSCEGLRRPRLCWARMGGARCLGRDQFLGRGGRDDSRFLLEICPFFVTLTQWIKPSKKGTGRCRFASKAESEIHSPPKSY